MHLAVGMGVTVKHAGKMNVERNGEETGGTVLVSDTLIVLL